MPVLIPRGCGTVARGFTLTIHRYMQSHFRTPSHSDREGAGLASSAFAETLGISDLTPPPCSVRRTSNISSRSLVDVHIPVFSHYAVAPVCDSLSLSSKNIRLFLFRTAPGLDRMVLSWPQPAANWPWGSFTVK